MNELVQEITGRRIQTGMRFIEQPELRTPSDHDGKRHSPALPGGQPARLLAAQTQGDTEPIECLVGGHDGLARRPRPEPHVLGDREVVVEG